MYFSKKVEFISLFLLGAVDKKEAICYNEGKSRVRRPKKDMLPEKEDPMKRKRILAWLLIVALSIPLCTAFSSFAASGFSASEVLTFRGIEIEYGGRNGIRAVFSVNEDAVTRLESGGYRVTYGAIVGYSLAYPTFESLTLSAEKNAASITVYADGAKREAYFLERDGEPSFAIATFFGTHASVTAANRALTYRGYVTLERDGNAETYYLDAADPNMGDYPSFYTALLYMANRNYEIRERVLKLMDKFQDATVIYVDPNAAGGDGMTAATAVKTAKEAYERALSIIHAGEAADIVIRFSAGTHIFDSELLMQGKDITSSARYSITFEGAENGESILSTCYDIPASSFQSENRYYKYTLPDSMKKDGVFPAFRDLYIDGVPATPAQSKGLYHTVVDSAKYAEQNGLKQSDRLIYVAPSALGAVDVDESGNVIGDLEFWLQIDWEIYALRVEAIDYDAETEFIDQNNERLIPIRIVKEDWEDFTTKGGFNGGYYYSTFANRRYWFANNKAYLDTKGDFYYDRENGTIYVKPHRMIRETGVISFPQAEAIFHVKDMENIRFDNLSFTGTTVNYITDNGYITSQAGDIKSYWKDPDTGEYGRVGFLPYGAICGRDVTNLNVTDCRFSGVGGDGINFRGVVKGAAVTGCEFTDIGGAAVRFADSRYYSYTRDNQYNDIIVCNNFIQNTGVVFNSHPAVVIGQVKNLDLSYNTILDSAYSAISVSWNWGKYNGTVNTENAHIDYNYIENFMTKMQDGGAIYTLGGNAYETKADQAVYLNSMSHNYVVMTKETGNGSGHFTVFYHDQGSSHWLDEGNILIASSEATGTDHHYVSFQTIQPGVHNIKNDGMIFIGEVKEKRPYQNPTENGDGSLYFDDPALTGRANFYQNLYRYESFDAMAGTEQEDYVREVAGKAGCAAYKPTYGEWSAKK